MLDIVKKFKVYFIIGAVALTVIGVLGWYNSVLLAKVEFQAKQIQAKEIAIQQKERVNEEYRKTVAKWSESQAKLVATMQQLSDVSQASNKQIRKLNDVFSKHDLGNLALQKPRLIEKRINSGTIDNFRLLECSTGATSRYCDTGNQTAPKESQPSES